MLDRAPGRGCARATARAQAAPTWLQPVRVNRSGRLEVRGLETAGCRSTPGFWNDAARPSRKPGSRGIGGGETFAARLPWPGQRRWMVARSCWWTMCLPTPPRSRNARVFCAGRAHLKCMLRLCSDPESRCEGSNPAADLGGGRADHGGSRISRPANRHGGRRASRSAG